MPSLDTRFTRDEKISWQMIEDEAILIDHDEGEVLRLNPIGAEIWQSLDGTRTVNEIVDHIHQTFEVHRKKRVQNDVLHFLNQLIRREMVAETLGDGEEP